MAQQPSGFIPDPVQGGLPSGFIPDEPADFKQTDTTPNELDPNTIGTLATHFGQQSNPVPLGQIVPFPKAAGGGGWDAPLTFFKNFLSQQNAVKAKGDAAWAAGNHAEAIRHYTDWALSAVTAGMSMGMDKASDEMQSGHYMAGLGDTLGIAMAAFVAPKAIPAVVERVGALLPKRATGTTPATPEPVNPRIAFGEQHNIPLDAKTVSDNAFVQQGQELADRSTFGGAMVAEGAKKTQRAAMQRTGQTLANKIRPVVTPEQAGLSLERSLTNKVARHEGEQRLNYDTVRNAEALPENQMTMPGAKAPVDVLAEPIQRQMRRIVHEMDASGFTPRLLEAGPKGGDLQHVEGTGGGGAEVYHDITQRSGSTATRGKVQTELEDYLGGGPETPNVKAALEVAGERYSGRTGAVSTPELGSGAFDVPTRLEGKRSGSDMGFPVELAPVKKSLQPVYEQMRHQMPITQQQANPGLKAIQNILEGPDWAPLSQIDRDLGAIKRIAREQGGLAKLAVRQLNDAVAKAAAQGGPAIVDALKAGRIATIRKYATQAILDKSLKSEPAQRVKALTALDDSAIRGLRRTLAQAPEQAPVLARATLERILRSKQKVSNWRQLGPSTRALLFPDPEHLKALDQFFDLTDRMSHVSNPSGSGHMVALTAQALGIFIDPMSTVALQITGAVASKLLRSKAVVRALTTAAQTPLAAPVAVRSAVAANLTRAALQAGVHLTPDEQAVK